MTGTFKANNPYNNFLLLAYGLVLKLPIFIFPVIPKANATDGILYKALLNWLVPIAGSTPVIYSLIAFPLLYLQAISFNKLVNDSRLFPRTNYLSGMSYLLITSLFKEWYVLSAPLIIITLLIWVLTRLCNLYNNPQAKTSLFNIGILTGLATLFYFPTILFLLLIIVGLILTRPFSLPEWIIAFVGFLSAWYFLAAWVFLTDYWPQYNLPSVTLSLPVFHLSAWSWLAIVLVLFSLALGIYFIRSNTMRLVLQSRKSWSLIYIYLIVAMLVPFLNAVPKFEYWILTSIPISAFAAAAFLFPEKKWYAVSMHWGLVMLSVITGYFIK